MVSYKQDLQLYLPNIERVEVADGRDIVSAGSGNLPFLSNQGPAVIRNLLHCPTLTTDLLLVSKFDNGQNGSGGNASVVLDGKLFLLPKH
jgi:hypothetical protein